MKCRIQKTEIERFIPKGYSDAVKQDLIKKILEKKIHEFHFVFITENYYELEIPDSQVLKETFRGTEFYIHKRNQYAITQKDGVWYILLQ